MAIIFTTGTIDAPDAGSVGIEMIEKIRDDVVAHAAWELAEEFTAPGGVVRWYVFKCLAVESGLPYDFFVIIGRTLSNGELHAFVCETYTTGSHVAQYYSPYSGSMDLAYDAVGRHATEFTLSTAQLTSGSSTPQNVLWTPAGTSTKWWLTVAEDGFTVAFNGSSNGFMHFGAYTPLTQMPILFPIQFAGSNFLSSNSYGGITRNPAAANITTRAAALRFLGGEGSSISGQSLGFVGDLRYNDKLQNNQRPVSEVGMVIPEYQQGDRAIYGYVLGKQKRMRWTVFEIPAGLAFGDAYVLNGNLWVPYAPTDKRMWDTGVAAS